MPSSINLVLTQLLLEHGANTNLRTPDGKTPLDLATDEDVRDLLRGDVALLEAARMGNLEKVKKLCTPRNVNCQVGADHLLNLGSVMA